MSAPDNLAPDHKPAIIMDDIEDASAQNPRTPEDRRALTDRIEEVLRSPHITISRVHLPDQPDSPLKRCCADLCDRTARQESNVAPDTDGPDDPEEGTNLSYEQVIDLAVEIELRQDSLKGPMSRGELICCLLRTLDGVGVRVW